MLEVIALVGTVLSDAVPCQRLQLDDGSRVWISGLPHDIETGDTIRIEGSWRFLMSCQAKAFVAVSVEKLPQTPITGD